METSNARELVRQCASDSEPEAWRVLIERFGGRIRSGVHRALRRSAVRLKPEDLEDLLQEVYCRLLEKDRRGLRRCRGESERSVAAYLGKIAESVAIDYLRASAADKRGRDRLVGPPQDSPRDWIAEASDSGPSPEERLLANERRRLLLRRCSSRRPKQSMRRDMRVFYLAFFEGWTSEEIAESSEGALTRGGIDCLLHRMRRRLRKDGLSLPHR